jgi:hypothetical protein
MIQALVMLTLKQVSSQTIGVEHILIVLLEIS